MTRAKKQSIIVWIIAAHVLCIFASLVFAGPVIPDSSPESKQSKYSYTDEDKPDAWFFPKDKARWDGYKVTSWNWVELTDVQKNMFISEGIAELERTEDAKVTVENKWRLSNSVNTMVNMMSEKFSNSKISMIKILLDSLTETGYIKLKSGADPKKADLNSFY